VFVDVDDTIIEVHGHQKQGAGFGYSGVRGINALLATVSTETSAPVIIAQRLRRGATGSPKGAARIVADALKTVTRLPGERTTPVLLRADSAYYGLPTVNAAIKAGADVSITARQDPAVKRAIATIPDDAWQKIKYTNAIFDHDITTTALDTVTADQVHRRHAIIEQVHADLKGSALAHLPSGRFTANAAWLALAVIAFNLTRTAATITGPDLRSATTATIRRKLITVPARIASSGRRITLHLPRAWPWEAAWTTLFSHALAPPQR
jgi:Transposase DDE domain group 1